MYRALSLAAVLFLAACGDDAPKGGATADSPAPAAASAPATGCAASGLDAMSAMADFETELQAAKDAGRITTEQLLATRDKLFTESQALAAKNDWAGYCKLIEDTRKALGL